MLRAMGVEMCLRHSFRGDHKELLLDMCRAVRTVCVCFCLCVCVCCYSKDSVRIIHSNY